MKRIAIFCDGTWNKMSAEHSTNVLLAAQSVLPKAGDGVQQLTYYDEGVGTSFIVNKWLETRLAGAFGLGLLDKIEAAYRFLIFNYEPGDEIFIFGFSRGAFTARSLAGLIRKCGIIPRSQAKSIKRIFKFYKDSATKPGSDNAQQFRMDHSPQVILKEEDRAWRIQHGADPEQTSKLPVLNMKYLGVWDTVGALGIPHHLLLSKLTGAAEKYQFHDTELSSTVRAARHAVAIDEDRLSFAPALWSNLDILNEAAGEQKYEQLWFPGDHGSVGGGGDIQGLSNDAFVWIMEGAEREGLALDQAKLQSARDTSDHLAPLCNQTEPPSLLDRIYRRGHREGPQQRSLLSRSAQLRLEYETRGNGVWPPYRPKAISALWPKSALSQH